MMPGRSNILERNRLNINKIHKPRAAKGEHAV